MKDFLRILRRFVPPSKKFMVWNVIFNVLSAILNLFSFALIIPILNILFKISDETYTYTDWTFAPFSVSYTHLDVYKRQLDATRGIESQDLNIFSLVQKNKKGLVGCVNKWDLVEDKSQKAVSYTHLSKYP